MNILHVISSLDLNTGGPAQGIRNLTYFYKEQGVQATLLGFDEKNVTEDITHADCVNLWPKQKKTGYISKLIPWLNTNIHNFDAVVIHGLWLYHNLGVYKALKDSKVPYYIYPHGMLDPWFNKKYPLKYLKKLIYWHLIQYKILKKAKSVLFTCKEEEILAKEAFKPNDYNTFVTNYGTKLNIEREEIDTNLFYEKYPLLKNKKIILFMSRIHKKKGCDLLINSFKNILGNNSEYHLVMAGPDQTGWKKELIQLSKDLKIESKITWTGMITDKLKLSTIKASEVSILPSHQENFGITIAEALSIGCPILTTNKVNIWREIEEMNAGFVENDDQKGIDSLLKKWITLDKNEKLEMSENAIKCFNEKFDVKQASINLINFIKKDIQC